MKARLIILWCLVAVLLCSCASGTQKIENKYYSIDNRDGKTYMKFTPALSEQIQTASGNMSVAIIYPKFTSVSDMHRKITTGDIPLEELASLQQSSKDNVLEICDPNTLCDLTLPDNVLFKHIYWCGDYYSFSLEVGEESYTAVVFQPDAFNKRFEEEYVNFLVPETDQVLTDTEVEDRNARVVHYVRPLIGRFKDVFYTVTTPRGTILVRETYVMEYYAGYTGTYQASETVPQNVYLFGTEGENHFYARFLGLGYRPSVEWISSFGLVPYKAQNPG